MSAEQFCTDSHFARPSSGGGEGCSGSSADPGPESTFHAGRGASAGLSMMRVSERLHSINTRPICKLGTQYYPLWDAGPTLRKALLRTCRIVYHALQSKERSSLAVFQGVVGDREVNDSYASIRRMIKYVLMRYYCHVYLNGKNRQTLWRDLQNCRVDVELRGPFYLRMLMKQNHFKWTISKVLSVKCLLKNYIQEWTWNYYVWILLVWNVYM